MSLITQNIFKEAIIFLANSIVIYLLANSGKNIISIVKIKEFTDYLLEQLNKKFN
jgi:hypothetical protein